MAFLDNLVDVQNWSGSRRSYPALIFDYEIVCRKKI